MSFAFITVVIAILIVDNAVPWNQLFQSVEAKSLSGDSSSSFVNHAEGKIHSDNKILSSILASKASRSSSDNGNGGSSSSHSSSHSSSDGSTSNSGTSMGNPAGSSPDLAGGSSGSSSAPAVINSNPAGSSPDLAGGSSGSSSSSLAAPYDSGTVSNGQNSDSSTAGSVTGNTGGDKPIGPSNAYNANNIPFILPFP